jgi:dephospho-CoA kinase
VDGIRSGVEVEAFEEAFGEDFRLVRIEAPFDLRAERLSERGRDADETAGGESLEARDERELGFGMGRAMERADVTIENDGTLSEFRDTVRELLRE